MKNVTVGEFIVESQNNFPGSTGELSKILSAIKLASKILSHQINKAGLAKEILGSAGRENVQGEDQQKLDVFANDTFINALSARGVICGVASEENDSFIAFNDNVNNDAKYVVLIDPLDGSSNIDVNVKGVNGFTFDPSIGVFFLSNPDMKIPDMGKIYSVNEGNLNQFKQPVRDYISYCQSEQNKSNYTSRYIGSLVADFHRNLIKGGIYMYPSNTKNLNGKLRLTYECAPLAFLVEQAGGRAISETQRIMDIVPSELHERVPFFVGSKSMVNHLEEILAGESK